MDGYLKQATAAQVRWIGPFIDDTDFKTAKTALTIANTDIKVSKNGGASASKNSGGGTHDVNGMYAVTWDATDTATVGELKFSVKVTAALQVFGSYVVVEEAIYDALFAASAPGYLQPTVAARTLDVSAGGEAGVDWANVGSPTTALNLSGTSTKALEPTTAGRTLDVTATGEAGIDWANIGAPTTVVNLSGTSTKALEPTTAGRTLDVTATGEAGVDWANIGAPTTVVALSGTTVKTATDVEAKLPSALVGGRIDASVGAMAANVLTATAINADAITAAKIADGAIDRATFAADTGLQTVRSNTAASGAATTITLDASASAVDDFYNNCLIFLTGGTGVGQARVIADYVGATKVATVPTWVTNPDNTSTFAIIAVQDAALTAAGNIKADAVAISGDATAADNLETMLDGTGGMNLTANFIGSLNGSVTGNVDGSIAGGVFGSVASIGAGGIAAASFAAGAINAAAIAADAIGASEIADGAIDAGAIAADAITDAKFDSTGKLRSHFSAVLKLVVGVGSTTTAVKFSTVDGAAPSATNDFYKGRVIVLTSGALAGQATSITSYDGATTTATVPALTGAPANTVTAVIA